MVDKNSQKSRGFGFVVMRDPAKVDEILKKQPHVIDGKVVECKMAIPKETIIQNENINSSMSINQTNSKQIDEGINQMYNPRKIFVGGLPAMLKEDDLKSYFESYGEIEECILMYDKNTGRPRGFGFIVFKSIESADNVMKDKNKHNLKGKWVDCKRATPKEYMPESYCSNNNNNQINNSNRNISITSKFSNIANEKLKDAKTPIFNSLSTGSPKLYCENVYIENYGNLYQNISSHLEQNRGNLNINSNNYNNNNYYSNPSQTGSSPFNNMNFLTYSPINQLNFLNNNNIKFDSNNNNYNPGSDYQHPYNSYNNNNFISSNNEKHLINNNFNNNRNVFYNSNTYNCYNDINITEESINEYMENFKKK